MSFNDRFEQVKIQWGNHYQNYIQQLNTKLSENVNFPSRITQTVDVGTSSEPLVVENTIKIKHWKDLVQQEITDLSNVIQELKTLRDEVIQDTETNFDNQNLISNFEQGENVDKTINTIDNDINNWKSIYEYNLNKYNKRKQSIHGALMQAKENTDLYNYSVSGAVNIIAGVLILTFLIYNLYKDPTGVGTNKKSTDTKKSEPTASKKPTTTATKKPTSTDVKKAETTDVKKAATSETKTLAGVLDVKKAATTDVKKPPGISDAKKPMTI